MSELKIPQLPDGRKPRERMLSFRASGATSAALKRLARRHGFSGVSSLLARVAEELVSLNAEGK